MTDTERRRPDDGCFVYGIASRLVFIGSSKSERPADGGANGSDVAGTKGATRAVAMNIMCETSANVVGTAGYFKSIS